MDKEGGVYPVSKIIMAAHSNVLRNIFTYEADKSKTNFYLEAVPGLGLVLILDWIESGEGQGGGELAELGQCGGCSGDS